jgi:hypothetical protein
MCVDERPVVCSLSMDALERVPTGFTVDRRAMTSDGVEVDDIQANREVQPEDDVEVEEAQHRIERVETHNRPAGDDQGIADQESRGGSPGGAPSW